MSEFHDGEEVVFIIKKERFNLSEDTIGIGKINGNPWSNPGKDGDYTIRPIGYYILQGDTSFKVNTSFSADYAYSKEVYNSELFKLLREMEEDRE